MPKLDTESWEQYVWRTAKKFHVESAVMATYYFYIDEGYFKFEAAEKALRDWEIENNNNNEVG
jgi:hypothetical protein